MKDKTLKLLSTILFLCFFGVGLLCLYGIFSWKDTSGDYYSSVNQMYSLENNTVDVAFFGPSVFYQSLNPAIFWEKEGISSFNGAVSGQDREASTYFVKEFLKKQSPKVVVLSATYFYTDEYAVLGNLYRNTISLRQSSNSFRLINHLLPLNENIEELRDQKISDYLYRWPIVHGRYRELQKNDFIPVKEYQNCLGYFYAYQSGSLEEFSPVSFDHDVMLKASEENKKWISELKELADKEGFQILVLSVPMEFHEENREILNGCLSYLDEIGIAHLDLNDYLSEMSFYPFDDMVDQNHANFYGAQKISSFLSDYLTEHFPLEDHRGQKGYERYEKCLEVYEHESLEHETLPYASLGELTKICVETKGLITAITLYPESGDIPEIAAYLTQAGVSDDELQRGGTFILQNQTILARPSDKTYGHQVNSSSYLYVWPASPDAPGHDTVFVGETCMISPSLEGSAILLYDTILDRVIDVYVVD